MDDLTQQNSRPTALLILLWIALALALGVKFDLQYQNLFSANTGTPQLIQLASPLAVASSQPIASQSQVLHLTPLDVAPDGQRGDLYMDTQGQLHFHNGQEWTVVIKAH